MTDIMGIAGSGLALLAIILSFSWSLCDDIDDIIQFDEEPDDLYGKPLKEENENVIYLGDLKKQKWKDSLRKYDQNKDGKLSGNELLLAYPEIQSLMENGDNDQFWWSTPEAGMFVAVAIGVVTLGFALFKMRRWMSSQDAERSRQYEMKKQQWLNKLEGRKTEGEDGSGDQDSGESSDENERQHRMEMSCSSSTKSSPKDPSLKEHAAESATGMPETGEDENSSKLQKRKPEVTRDIVTSKMARYQQLSAVRRHPGNQSPKSDTRVFQQLLPDEDDVNEMSGDEIVGKTRKRRQRAAGLPVDLQEKIARDSDFTVNETESLNNLETSVDKMDKISAEDNPEAHAGTKDSVSEVVKKNGDCKEAKESARSEDKEDSDFEELYLVSSPLKEKPGHVSTEVLDDLSEPKTVSSESSGFLSESKDFSGKSKTESQ